MAERLPRIVRCAAIALLLTSTACVPIRAAQPTEALIARFEPLSAGAQALRVCVVHLGWTRDELVKTCGVPVAEVSSARPEESGCLLYRTFSAPLSTAYGGQSSSRYVAACLSRDTWRGEARPLVVSVAGLTQIPGTITSTTGGESRSGATDDAARPLVVVEEQHGLRVVAPVRGLMQGDLITAIGGNNPTFAALRGIRDHGAVLTVFREGVERQVKIAPGQVSGARRTR